MLLRPSIQFFINHVILHLSTFVWHLYHHLPINYLPKLNLYFTILLYVVHMAFAPQLPFIWLILILLIIVYIVLLVYTYNTKKDTHLIDEYLYIINI